MKDSISTGWKQKPRENSKPPLKGMMRASKMSPRAKPLLISEIHHRMGLIREQIVNDETLRFQVKRLSRKSEWIVEQKSR